MAITKDTAIQQRYLHRDEAGVKPLSDAEIAELNKSFNIQEELGIPVGTDGYSGYTKATNVPRVFLTTTNDDMSETLKSPDKMGIKIGSKEFWRQVQLGNVFVYPAGQKGASQLQVSDPAKGEPSVSLSREIKYADDLPDREIKKPGFFKRVFSFLSTRWKEEVRSYDNQGKSNTQIAYGADQNFRTTDIAKQELSDLESSRARKQKEAEQEARSGNVEKVQKRYTSMIEKDENVERIFGPKPNPRTKWYADNSGSGHAHKKTFEAMESYDKLDLGKIKSSTLKEPFSDQDFTTLAFFTSNSKDILAKSVESREGTRNGDAAHNAEALQMIGLDEKTAKEIANEHAANNSTWDYYDDSDPREATGDQVIGSMIEPARKETYEAFKDYSTGDKNKMAELVASAVGVSANAFCTVDPLTANQLGDRTAGGMISQAGNLSDLMEKDPELVKIAKEKYGMKESDLKVVKGMGAYKKLNDERKTAQERLTRAEMKGEPMEANEKKQCLKKIVKADLAEQIIINDLKNRKLTKEQKQLCDAVLETVDVPRVVIDPVTQEKHTEPLPKGKISGYTATNIANVILPGRLCERPAFLQSLTTNDVKLDAAAESIIKQEGLYRADMSPKDVFEKVDGHLYSAESLKNAADIISGKAEPEKSVNGPQVGGPQVGKGSIADRAKMFESQVGGPKH